MDERFVTIEEAMEITGLGATFIKTAIKQGTMPGSYIKNGTRTTYHIPRKALEDYMATYHRSPSDDLISILIEKYQELIRRKWKMKKRVLNARGEALLALIAVIGVGVVEATDNLWVAVIGLVIAIALTYIELMYTKGE